MPETALRCRNARQGASSLEGRAVRARRRDRGRQGDRPQGGCRGREAAAGRRRAAASTAAAGRDEELHRQGDLPFFVLSLVILGLTLLHATAVVPGSERAIVRFVFSGILFVQALLLFTNWHQANERIGQKVLTQMWGHRGAMNRRERAVARILRDGLILIGIVFLAAAVFELVVGITGG